ncbi:MAG: efflux RND transporter permease subunit [Desulforegulaceae bacterium]|nr:efflux RND transporter permease subunit [Desulforegulaceae bacterium]
MLTKFSIKNYILTLSILAVIIISGISYFQSMPRDDMPPFLIRYMTVVTTYSGASPDRIENLISDKIEKVVQEIPEVDYMTSESRTGISIVSISLKENVYDLQPVFDRIRRKVEDVKKDLPEGCSVKIDDEVGDVFGIIIGLTAQGYSFAEINDIADEIRDELIKLPDAAKVEISGKQEEKIYVEFDDARLLETGLTKAKLSDLISKTNIIIPGGEIKTGEQRIILEPTGNFESIEDLKNMIVSSSEGKIIRLSNISKIRKGYEEPVKNIVRINKTPGLAIGVNLKKGGNIINLGIQVDQKLNELRQKYPYGVEFERVASQDFVVEKSVNDFVGNLFQSVIVVLIVMLLFLGLRTGFIVASLIPCAIVSTIFLMYLTDIGLNKVSLASLIIALGMLVDNGIVMSESVLVKMEEGKSSLNAAIESSKELLIPLLTSSITTSAAFMAFFLADSVMGEIMGNIFVVVTYALLSSWILTLTIIALFCVYGIKKSSKQDKKQNSIFDKIALYYKNFLIFCLKHSFLTIASILVLFFLSITLVSKIPFIFMEKSDRALVTVNIELPIGTAIEKTSAVVEKIEEFVEKNLTSKPGKEGIVNYSSYIGEGAPKYDLGYNPPESNPNSAHILLNTTSDNINDYVIEKVDSFIFNNFPDATYKVSRLLSGGGSANPVEIRLSGKKIENLYSVSEEIKEKLRKIPGAKNIDDNWGMKTKKLVIDINTASAQMAGITNQDIAVSLQTILSGVSTGFFREGDKSIPIIMKNEKADLLKIEDLKTINIYDQQTGKGVPLSQVADIRVEWQPTKILRRDLTKTVTVTSDVKSGFTASDITRAITPWLNENKTLKQNNITFELGGDAEGSADAMGAVANKLPVSFFIIVIVLIAQFNSLRKPLIIILTIPLGLIGVIPGLFITGSYFGFMGFLGVISLAGIVINNAIVLIDRIKIEETENSKDTFHAIIDAGIQRLRPILLTTATTALGLIPLWLGGGLMWEPMAISIIFGLLFATVLTLVFVPVLYKIFFRVSYQNY